MSTEEEKKIAQEKLNISYGVCAALVIMIVYLICHDGFKAKAPLSEDGKFVLTPSVDKVSILEIEKDKLTLDGELLDTKELYLKKAAKGDHKKPRGIYIKCEEE